DRAVENENARPVCGVAGPHQRHDVDRMELGKFDARKVQGDGLRHGGAPGAATVSPSSLVKVATGLERSDSTFSDGRQRAAPFSVTTIGRLIRIGCTIIVAVLSLVDLRTPRTIWRYSRADFAAMAATIAVTLLLGVEPGVIAGVGLSLALYLWRSSRPHAAIVGRVPETGHFRNVKRHKVLTDPRVLTIRIDESLTYLNARWLEEFVLETVADYPEAKHLVLMASAVNSIDASALESLEAINHRLADGGIKLHLSEVKGPVMDRLQRSSFLEE